ncbi:hypothetical protein C0992_002573 [Termitomyces sp. T32_za158]|nr:hypothetical protein C0992_002573 [Termitomyces sp. T32_za158]
MLSRNEMRYRHQQWMRRLRAYRTAAAWPTSLVAGDLDRLRSSLLGLLGTAHPTLSEIAQCNASDTRGQFRPLLVLLFSHATNGLGSSWPTKQRDALLEDPAAALDSPLTRPDILNVPHPSTPTHAASFAGVFDLHPAGLDAPPPAPAPAPAPTAYIPALASPSCLLPTQRRLAQIVEMIHIAAVFHDEVNDNDSVGTSTSAGAGAPFLDGFGNLLPILSGDFLLGRVSTALARLGEAEAFELLATVLANQAEGDMLRVHDTDTYLRKTYLRTASLVAKGARATAILGGCAHDTAIWRDVAYAYGRNVGFAYQLVEDTLRGPARARVTGPVLFAAEEHPELRPLIRRDLADEGDVEQARDYVSRSHGVERTRALALSYAEKAREALAFLPNSEHKSALDVLAHAAATRTWL